jgi:hypothetical protein
MERLAETIAAHAARIPPTLAYARAQNNNHLLTEAVGLYTAGAALAEHPRADYWRDLGWRWLNAALQSQIDGDGTYIQHSTNYTAWRANRPVVPPAARSTDRLS